MTGGRGEGKAGAIRRKGWRQNRGRYMRCGNGRKELKQEKKGEREEQEERVEIYVKGRMGREGRRQEKRGSRRDRGGIGIGKKEGKKEGITGREDVEESTRKGGWRGGRSM